MIGPLSPKALICLDSILDAFSWTRETSSQDSKIYLDLINGDLSGSPREQDLIEAFLSEISETQKWRLSDLIKARIEKRQQKQQNKLLRILSESQNLSNPNTIELLALAESNSDLAHKLEDVIEEKGAIQLQLQED